MISNTAITIDFKSKDCKNNRHQKCNSTWQGLGFDVFCDCKCHKKKEGQPLASVVDPVADTVQNRKSSSMEVIQKDDYKKVNIKR